MKRIGITAAIILGAAALFAGGLDKVAVKIEGVSLTDTASEGTTTKVRGYLERIDLTFANHTSSVAIAVAASNAYTGANRTLLSIDAVSNNTTYVPRDTVVNSANAAAFTNGFTRFCLLDEVITLTATNSSYSNQNVQATFIYERP
jgi:hypothetical protein